MGQGHATRIDIERGRATKQDKWGNDGADALAVKGAESHRAPDDIVHSAQERKASAKIVQKMMVAVLKARLHAERTHVLVAVDRGSELGDCDEEDPDTEMIQSTDCIDMLDDDVDVRDCTLSGSN